MSWDSKLFQRHLQTRRFGREFVFLETTDSTNAWLLAHEREFPMTGTVVVADHQTAGRGRYDRQWLDVPGKSLLFSVLVRYRVEAASAAIMNLLPAIALARVLSESASIGLVFRLKWPNDVLLRGKKICGILGQSAVAGNMATAVLGIGINVNLTEDDIPDTFRPGATSILIESGDSVVREILLADFLFQLELLHDDFLNGDFDRIRTEWETYGPRFGERLECTDSGRVVCGEYAGLGSRGELMIKTSDGKTLQLLTGDIAQ